MGRASRLDSLTVDWRRRLSLDGADRWLLMVDGALARLETEPPGARPEHDASSQRSAASQEDALHHCASLADRRTPS